MKAVALVLLMVMIASCQPTPMAKSDEEEYDDATFNLTEPIALAATVDGKKFGFVPRLPVVPGRRAGNQSQREFTITAAILGSDVGSFVLYDFKTLEFKPGGGEGGGLGRWERETEGYKVTIDGEEVTEITFTNGDEKTLLLTHSQMGAHPHQMLALTVKLLDTNGNIVAEFIDPWDIQP